MLTCKIGHRASRIVLKQTKKSPKEQKTIMLKSVFLYIGHKIKK